jgi:hypothetical protein
VDKPLESDWKTFRKRVPEWRERYLTAKNQQLVALLGDISKTPTERFWDLEKQHQKTARVLYDCLDGHTRSRMEMYLCLMYRHQMIKAEDLDEFSAPLKERILRMAEAFGG